MRLQQINYYLIISVVGLFFFLNKSHAQKTHKWIDSICQNYINKHYIVGMTMAIVEPDSIYYGVSGYLKQNQPELVTLKNNFFLASLSKSFVSFIAKKMEEDSLISFDTKFFDVFPELLSIKNSKKYREITLGDLLSHKARINDSFLNDKTIPTASLTNTEKRLELVKRKLKKSPKSKNTYSNVGYIMAALMLEKITGTNYEDLIDNMLESLALNHIIGYPNSHDKNDTWGHNIFFKGEKRFNLSEFNNFSDFQLPYWGLSMSIIDYSKYIQLHLNGLLGRDNILKSDSYIKLHHSYKKFNYGWITDKLSTSKVSTHDGSGDVFFARVVIVKEKKAAIVIFYNQTATRLKTLNDFIEYVVKNYKVQINNFN
jgi:CubicO group peptidase (beta-lactamase class C family)